MFNYLQIIVLLCLCVLPLQAQKDNPRYKSYQNNSEIKPYVKKLNGYLLQIKRQKTVGQHGDSLCRASVISANGNLIFQAEELVIELDEITGKDINGDNKPEAVFVGYSGGAHCCWTYWIVSLGAKPGLIQKIENERDVAFIDIDNDRRIEIGALDGNFDYFDCLSHAETPFPQVIFRLEGRRLRNISHEFRSRYDREIVERRAKLSDPELNSFRIAKNVCEGSARKTMPKVLEIVLAYLYSGRETVAWRTLREMWPPYDFDRIRKKIIKTRRDGVLKYVNK